MDLYKSPQLLVIAAKLSLFPNQSHHFSAKFDEKCLFCNLLLDKMNKVYYVYFVV